MEDKNRKKICRINNTLLYVLIVLIIATLGVCVVNIIKVQTADTGQGQTMATEAPEHSLSNQYYTIGNNPTEINRTCFQELNTALEKETVDSAEVAQSVVKCFITEYYTWTNKDGNYDIGGMQYIYSEKKDDFAKYTLYNFYKDMDLYITQYGTDNLMKVDTVTINSATNIGTYTVALPTDTSEVSDDTNVSTLDLECIDVNASWVYAENTSIDVSQFQNTAVFHVVNNNGRWEIAGISSL